MTPNILILGRTQAGKTTAAEILVKKFGWSTSNTSDQIIHDYAENCGLGLTVNEILANKDQHRMALYEYGIEAQSVEPDYPVGRMLKTSNIIAGVRTPEQLKAVHSLFDNILWIEKDVPAGPTDAISWDLLRSGGYGAIKIDNNGTIKEMEAMLCSLFIPDSCPVCHTTKSVMFKDGWLECSRCGSHCHLTSLPGASEA